MKSWRIWYKKKFAIISLLGFFSGLPLALTSGSLIIWFTASGVSLVGIGMLTLVQQPYIFKFLWAPLMDRYVPFLGPGRRRGWILLCQIGVVLSLLWMSGLSPVRHPMHLAVMAVMLAFFSASQDISIDAYRTDIVTPQERGPTAGLFTITYRLAMLVSGAIAVVMASQWGWPAIYKMMAFIMILGTLLVLWASPSPAIKPPNNMREAVVDPWREFINRPGVLWIIVFILLYKLCDVFALTMSSVFLMRALGFSMLAIGSVTKVFGLCGSLLGSLIAGIIMVRWSLYRSLMVFGILQTLSNLGYLVLLYVGHNTAWMAAAVSLEYFCGGLSSVAFVAFIMSLCHHKYTATQYALFTALMAVPRVYVGPLAGWLAAVWGWYWFFVFSIVLGVPALLLLYWRQQTASPLCKAEVEL